MKKCIAVAVLMLGATLASAQSVRIVPSQLSRQFGGDEKPANAIKYEDQPIKFLYVAGHWQSLDKKNPIVGFSISEISCIKPGLYNERGGCTEDMVSITPLFEFQVSVSHNDYKIVSWTAEGAVARYVGGACKIAHTLTFDFKTGSVLSTDYPTANPELEVCRIYTSLDKYQLMDGESFGLEVVK